MASLSQGIGNQQQFLCPSLCYTWSSIFFYGQDFTKRVTHQKSKAVAKFNRPVDNYHAPGGVGDGIGHSRQFLTIPKNAYYCLIMHSEVCLWSFFWHLIVVFVWSIETVWLMSTFCQMHPCLSLIGHNKYWGFFSIHVPNITIFSLNYILGFIVQFEMKHFYYKFWSQFWILARKV